jgi:hypothetical protein
VKRPSPRRRRQSGGEKHRPSDSAAPVVASRADGSPTDLAAWREQIAAASLSHADEVITLGW